MILYAKEMYIDQLKKLWVDVFGDSEEYVNAFFDAVYQPENVIIWLENEEVWAALYMIPYKLFLADASSAVYLYALSTQETARSKGIMTKLLLESEKIAKERRYQFQFLIPCNEQIKDYYKKIGFQNGICKTKAILTENEMMQNKCQDFVIYETEVNIELDYKEVPMMIKKGMDQQTKTEIILDKLLM